MERVGFLYLENLIVENLNFGSIAMIFGWLQAGFHCLQLMKFGFWKEVEYLQTE